MVIFLGAAHHDLFLPEMKKPGFTLLIHYNKKHFGGAKQGLGGYPEPSDIPCLRSHVAERSDCCWA
jgi:hypothetical protein